MSQIDNWLLFGQPGSGKTTLAKELQKKLWDTEVIDGDDLRALTDNKVYGKEGRIKNIQNAALIAKYLNSKGTSVILSVVAPYKELRDIIKEALPGITMVYMHYDRTMIERGREHFWVEDFEITTLDYDIHVDTGMISTEVAATHIINHNQKKRFNAPIKNKI